MRTSPSRNTRTAATALLALLLAACAKPPSARECDSHADCPSGTTCQLGVCQEGLALDFISPSAGVTTTNDGVAVEVAVAGATPASVQLLVDDVEVATLTSPFTHLLDTASLSEESHQLVASAELGGRTFRSSPRTIVVDRTAPDAPSISPAITNALDPVTVSGTAEAGAVVIVYEGAVALASGVVTGAGGAWSTAFALAEGSHGLTATATDAAGNVSGLSSLATVKVDRTAPTVAARTPAPAATNVWSRDPITVTFDEAIKASSVTDSTVPFARSGGSALAKTLALSPDGLVLTITPTSLPAVPDDLQATLNGLTDLAGNPLALTNWSWTLPEWQDLGTAWTGGNRSNVTWLTLAVGESGNPAVAAYSQGVVSGGVVTRYTGSGWSALTEPSWTSLPSSGSMVLAAGDLPALAWGASTPTTDMRAARWDGSAWSTPQVVDIVQANATKSPAMGLDETGAPYVAWVETVSTLDRIYARRWNGSTWAQLGSGAISSATDPAAGPTATVGVARVTWTETDTTPTTRVKSNLYAGGAWGATPFSAALTTTLVGGAPLVTPAGTAYLLAPGSVVQAWKWFLAIPYGPPAHWEQIPPDLNGAGTVSFPVMALDPAGEPVVAWQENGLGYVKRHDPTTGWVTLTTLPLSGINRLTVSQGGIIAAARIQTISQSPVVTVWRYNR